MNLFRRIIRRVSDSRSLVHGAMFYVAFRWFDRALGLISLIVLARLLVPEHFGIVAMASIVVGLLDELFNFGVHVLVLQKDKLSDDFLNSAWTLRLVQALFVGTMIAILAPFAASYYGEERVASAMYVLAGAAALYGLENFALVMFQRERQFFKEFQLSAIKRVTMFVVTVTLAFTLRSYWALVLGSLLSRVLAVGLSYAFYPVVHSVSFRFFRELFGAGKWLLIMNSLFYVWKRIDELVVGRLFSSTAMGHYTIAGEVSRMPTTELLAPISRALLPGLTSLRGKPEEIRQLVLSSLNVQSALALPAAMGIALCGQQISAIFLGPGWELAGQLMMLLPFAFAASALRYAGDYYLLSQGMQRTLAYMEGSYIIAFLLLLGLVRHYVQELEVQMVVLCRVAIDLLGVPITWIVAAVHSRTIRVRDQVKQILRPALATAAMCAVLVSTGVLESTGGLPALLGYVVLGAGTYVVTLAMAWILTGKPKDGVEQFVLARIKPAS